MFTLTRNLIRWAAKRKEKKMSIVLLGLDGAGKTTLLHAIKGEIPGVVSPTFGFNSETIAEASFQVDVYDLGGGKNIRGLWSKYLAEVYAVIFVVDAAASDRFPEAKEILMQTLGDPHLSGKPILIMANKQDLPTASSAPEVAAALGLTSLQNNRYQILPCIAKTPEGGTADKKIKEGFKWLTGQVSSVFNQLDPRVQQDTAVEKEKAEKEKEERRQRVEKMRAERAREREEQEKRDAQSKAAEAGTAPLVDNNESQQRAVAESEATFVGNGISAGRPSPGNLELPPLRGSPTLSPLGGDHSPGAMPGGVRSDSPSRNKVQLEPL